MLQAFEVHYIGRTKVRKNGESSAFGWVNNCWSVIFPEHVLRKWFCMENPAEESNLYAVLGAKSDSSPEELKSAYRRMVMQWHPDRCKENNAQEVFLRIQEAYDILKDSIKRAKYDAGMQLQKLSSQVPPDDDAKGFGFRTPLRCGNILVTGKQSGKWFVVDNIEVWMDILNGSGQTLVSSWVYGEDQPQERWV